MDVIKMLIAQILLGHIHVNVSLDTLAMERLAVVGEM